MAQTAISPGHSCLKSQKKSRVEILKQLNKARLTKFGGGFMTFSNFSYELSAPLRLRVQLQSRTRLKITASIAFLFRACFQGVLDTIAPLSRR